MSAPALARWATRWPTDYSTAGSLEFSRTGLDTITRASEAAGTGSDVLASICSR